MSIETWWVLEDGSVGDPMDVAPDKSGVLRHKDGRAVAYAPYGPKSRWGVDAEAERAKAKPRYGAPKKDMKPEEPQPGYKTRELKGE